MLFLVVIPVCSDKTSSSTSRDSIGTSRKTGSGNYCKTLRAIQRSDQSYSPFQMLVRFGKTRPPLQRVGIPQVVQGNGPPETTVKLLARSNDWIKRYGAFQLLFRSGATRRRLHRVGIPQVVQGKVLPETTVNIVKRSTGRIRSYGLFQQQLRSCATRPPLQLVGIPQVVQGNWPS